MNEKNIFYYKIYDDKEELNFFKSSLTRSALSALLRDYEGGHEKYINPDFVEFLRKHDPEAELIEVHNISY